MQNGLKVLIVLCFLDRILMPLGGVSSDFAWGRFEVKELYESVKKILNFKMVENVVTILKYSNFNGFKKFKF